MSFHLASTDAAGGYAAFLLQSLAVLAVLGVLAFVLVRIVAPRLARRTGGPHLRLEERLPLDTRSSLYLVSAFGEKLLLGGGGGDLRLIHRWPADKPSTDERDGGRRP